MRSGDSWKTGVYTVRCVWRQMEDNGVIHVVFVYLVFSYIDSC